MLKIEPFFMSNQRYLFFKGQGWHNLYNVELEITGGSFETSMRSQTDESGNLYMFWSIPRHLEDGSIFLQLMEYTVSNWLPG